MRNTPEIRLRSIAGQAGCEPDVALLWALIQIYRQSQVFGSARLTDIAERLRVPREVIESTFDRLADRGYALRTGDQLWLTQSGVRQVDCASAALVSRIVDKLATSPTFEGRPDREQVEAALERIAHRVLVQRDWDDDRAVPAPPPGDPPASSAPLSRTCSTFVAPGVRFRAMSRIGPFADDDAAAWVAKSPDIGVGMVGFTSAVYNKNRLPMRVRELARMVIALDNECVVCQNTRDSEGIAAGVDEDLYDHAAEWRTWPGYSPQERIAAEFAERFASDHTGLRDDEDFWERASEQFSDELLTDLALSCAMWLGMGRMLRTLDIGQTCKITL